MRWKGVASVMGEMWVMTLDDGLEALVGMRCALPMNGRVKRWLKRSVMEHGVIREKEKRWSPWWEMI